MKIKDLREGIKDGVPIALGYFAVSVAFGVSAVQAGIPSWGATLISLTNLTSAGQKAGVDVMAQGLGLGENLILLILSTLIINMRYFLMGVSLSQSVEEKMPMRKRLLIAFGITDEIYAVSMGKCRELSASYMAGLIVPPIIGWTGGTLVGSVATSVLPEILASAMGIALYGMFIAVIVPPSKENKNVLIAVCLAILLSVVFTYTPVLQAFSQWSVIIITVLVSAVMATLCPVKEDDKDE